MMITEKMIEAACDHKGKRVVCPSSAGPCCEGCGEPWPYDETPTPAPSDKIGMPVIQALSRMIDNRHSDRTSSIVSAEDRSLIIDGFHSLMAKAALSTDAEPVGSVAVKHGIVTPQMLLDTACWCQDEQELRDTLRMAAAALSEQVQYHAKIEDKA